MGLWFTLTRGDRAFSWNFAFVRIFPNFLCCLVASCTASCYHMTSDVILPHYFLLIKVK